METAQALSRLKGIKAIESVYDPVYGERITEEEKIAHIEYVAGNFMDDLRDEFWDNQPEEVKKYYERLADKEIETQVQMELKKKKLQERQAKKAEKRAKKET